MRKFDERYEARLHPMMAMWLGRDVPLLTLPSLTFLFLSILCFGPDCLYQLHRCLCLISFFFPLFPVLLLSFWSVSKKRRMCVYEE